MLWLAPDLEGRKDRHSQRRRASALRWGWMPVRIVYLANEGGNR